MSVSQKKISYEEIRQIVEVFYQKAATDILIGYHFDQIRDHLPEHIKRIADFWQLQLTGEMDHPESVPFHMISLHRARKIKRGELNRWILLFEQTLDESENLKFYDGLSQEWRDKISTFKEVFLHRILSSV